TAAFPDVSQSASEVRSVIQEPGKEKKGGWAVDPAEGKPHYLTLLPAKPLQVVPGSRLQVTVVEMVQHDHPPPAWLRFSSSEDARISEYAAVPDSVLQILTLAPANRDAQQKVALSEFYRANLDPDLKTQREKLAQ